MIKFQRRFDESTAAAVLQLNFISILLIPFVRELRRPHNDMLS